MRKLKLGMISTIMLGLLVFAGFAVAQQWQDPCTIYAHKTAFIPNGTPTSKIIAGVNGQAIYICRVSVENANNGTAVAETFYSGGEANASGTPCATGTTGGPAAVATLGAIAAGNGFSALGGDGNHTVYQVPTNSAGFPIDFCGLMGGGTGLIGQVDYVQK